MTEIRYFCVCTIYGRQHEKFHHTVRHIDRHKSNDKSTLSRTDIQAEKIMKSQIGQIDRQTETLRDT